MSCPFSRRDSGSAFMSQYWRPVGEEVLVVVVVRLVVESGDTDSSFGWGLEPDLGQESVWCLLARFID